MKKLYGMTLGALIGLTVAASGAHAQAWPVKPVRFIIPAPPGSAPDFLSRILGQKLSEVWGQTVVIDNVVGASGHIGTERAAKSPPDGYTILFNTIGPIAVNSSLFSKLPFDPIKDFAPITLVALTPNIVCLHPSVPVTNVKELIALAKSNPGKMHYGSGGPGTTQHLSGELFNVLAGVKIVHVIYKSSAQMTIDTIGGQIDLIFHNAPVVQPHVKSGKLRGIAVTSAKRLAGVPELPTMIEAGLPGFEVTAWFGLLAPTGTPPAVLTKIHSDTVRVLNMPDVRERFLSQAAVPSGNKPEEFAAFIQSETAKWAKVIKASGAKVD
ncbi:MAG: tripartite tricarboxylate transporter substrate binding protein [Burkholderiales bacterium]